MWSSPGHAATLTSIAETNAESFYRGELAEKIVEFIQKYDGFLTKEDLENYRAEWVDPISTNYRGYDVWEIPPNGQGLLALMALNIVSGFDFTEKDTIDTYHKQIEAIKLAFTEAKEVITDQKHMKISAEYLLSDEFAHINRLRINDKAITPEPVQQPSGGTVI